MQGRISHKTDGMVPLFPRTFQDPVPLVQVLHACGDIQLFEDSDHGKGGKLSEMAGMI